jgi:hypothetical protein
LTVVPQRAGVQAERRGLDRRADVDGQGGAIRPGEIRPSQEQPVHQCLGDVVRHRRGDDEEVGHDERGHRTSAELVGRRRNRGGSVDAVRLPHRRHLPGDVEQPQRNAGVEKADRARRKPPGPEEGVDVVAGQRFQGIVERQALQVHRAVKTGGLDQLFGDHLDAGLGRTDRDFTGAQHRHRGDRGVGANDNVQVVVVDAGQCGQFRLPGGRDGVRGDVGGTEGHVGLAGLQQSQIVRGAAGFQHFWPTDVQL